MVPASSGARQVYLSGLSALTFSATAAHPVMRSATIRSSMFLVLAQVADLVALGEHTPDLRPQSQRVRQHLENNVTVRRSKAAIAKGRKTQRVCSVIDKIKAPFE